MKLLNIILTVSLITIISVWCVATRLRFAWLAALEWLAWLGWLVTRKNWKDDVVEINVEVADPEQGESAGQEDC